MTNGCSVHCDATLCSDECDGNDNDGHDGGSDDSRDSGPYGTKVQTVERSPAETVLSADLARWHSLGSSKTVPRGKRQPPASILQYALKFSPIGIPGNARQTA